MDGKFSDILSDGRFVRRRIAPATARRRLDGNDRSIVAMTRAAAYCNDRGI